MSQLSLSFKTPLRGLVRVLPLLLGVASAAAITVGCNGDEPSDDGTPEGSGGGGEDPEGSTGGRGDGMGGESVTQMGGMGGEGEGGSASGGSSNGSGGDDGTGGEDGTGGAPTCVEPLSSLEYLWNGELLPPDGSFSMKAKELIKGHHAFVQGTSSFSFSAGPVGNSMNFVNDSYLQAFPPEGEWGLEAWGVSSLEFWFNSTNYSANLVSLGGLEDHMVGFGVRLFEGKPELYLKIYNSEAEKVDTYGASPNIPLNDGENHHIAVSIDMNDAVLSLYVDGEYTSQIVYEGAEVHDLVNAVIMNSYPIEMGGSKFAETTFTGQIDEVSFYAGELDAEEVADLYEAGSAGKCAD